MLNRYGLYCTACRLSPAEFLASGARAHGLRDDALQRLVAELNALDGSAPSAPVA